MERMPSGWVPIMTHGAHSLDAKQNPCSYSLFSRSRASGYDGGAVCWVPSPQVGDAAVCGLIWLVVAGLGRWLPRCARVAPAAFLTQWVSGLRA